MNRALDRIMNMTRQTPLTVEDAPLFRRKGRYLLRSAAFNGISDGLNARG